ncbi:MAG: sugar ABC transporter ATP-binding protein [Lachnospiraceae bacterium]|nr:sugar ABC transporter ATP-binding protein [Lachnospiraceae bacterium]
MPENSLLKMEGITKSFSGVTVLNHVNFEIRQGEIHALLGENGAGKSTLIKILAGIYHADAGRIFMKGEEVRLSSVSDAKSLGIQVIHQEISLVPGLSVLDNILLGTEEKGFFLNRKARREKAKRMMEDIGFEIDVDALVGSLSIAQQQIVEIIRALAFDDARLIVMDEPTASISEKDSEKLFSTIMRLKEKGISIIYISHRMEEIARIADRLTVLRDGSYVGTEDVKQISMQQIVKMMVGRQVEELYHYRVGEIGGPVLEMRDVSSKFVQHVDFELKKGEVHGLYGLIGAGRTELVKIIFGLDPYEGEIRLHGREVKILSARNAMEHGIALVPEDRKKEGLFLNNTIYFNSVITILKSFMKGFRIHKKQAKETMEQYRERLNIKYAHAGQPAGTLSGGNQQKVVLSKWLSTKPDILILDEPTRGIDIGAKSEIYDLIFRLIQENVSIILISSELPEIMNLCTRVTVMREGVVTGTVDREDFSQEMIFRYAI